LHADGKRESDTGVGSAPELERSGLPKVHPVCARWRCPGLPSPRASRAVLIAVNVNPYYRTVADVAAYSRENQLATIPSWHFLTGPLASLRTAWRGPGLPARRARRATGRRGR